MNTRICICTHKPYTFPAEPSYVPLETGAVSRPDFGPSYLKDDQGENISARNPYYSELTGMYWIWKHVDADIKGLCHYRRYFMDGEDILGGNAAEALLRDHDIILPATQLVDAPSVRAHYTARHHGADFETLREVIRDICPAFLFEFDVCAASRAISECNMLIARREVFDGYCAWLFPILFEAEKRIDCSGYDPYQKRVFGFLSERLMRVYVMHMGLRVCETDIREINPADMQNAEKRRALTRERTALLLQDLITLYRTGRDADAAPLVRRNPAIGQNLVPVWVASPAAEPSPIINTAVSAAVHAFPDCCGLCPVTTDNIETYVALPDWLREKYTRGAFSAEALMEFVRPAILYLYGGFWLDGRCLVTREIPEKFFIAEEFWTIRYNGANAYGRRVSGSTGVSSREYLLDTAVCLRPDSLGGTVPAVRRLFRFLANASLLCLAAAPYEDITEMREDLLSIALQTIPGAEDALAAVAPSNPALYDLAPLLSRKYTSARWQALSAATSFFDLTAAGDSPRETTIAGDPTMWAYIAHMDVLQN